MAIPNLLGILVTDMAAALRFYRLLGLEIPEEADEQPHVEYIAPGGFRIAWDDLAMVRQFDPDAEPPSGSSMNLAFLCESPESVDTLYESVTGAGYASHKAPWDAFWGQRYAIVIDPDGNHVDLFAPLPDSSAAL